MVLRTVLGERLERIPVSSSKSQFGTRSPRPAHWSRGHDAGTPRRHPAADARAARAGSRLAGVDLVTEAGRHAALGVAVSSSYGFGGHNVTLALARGDVA